jgi:hypothetical protein
VLAVKTVLGIVAPGEGMGKKALVEAHL